MLFLYSILSIIHLFITNIFRTQNIANISITGYTLIEFFIQGAILDIFLNKKIQYISAVLKISYIILVCIFIVTKNKIYQDGLWVANFPSVYLIIQSLYLTRNILKNIEVELTKNLAFLIVVSIFILHIISLPLDVYDYYILNSFVNNIYDLKSIFHLLIYSIFNLFLVISIKSCDK